MPQNNRIFQVTRGLPLALVVLSAFPSKIYINVKPNVQVDLGAFSSIISTTALLLCCAQGHAGSNTVATRFSIHKPLLLRASYSRGIYEVSNQPRSTTAPHSSESGSFSLLQRKKRASRCRICTKSGFVSGLGMHALKRATSGAVVAPASKKKNGWGTARLAQDMHASLLCLHPKVSEINAREAGNRHQDGIPRTNKLQKLHCFKPIPEARSLKSLLIITLYFTTFGFS